MFFAAASHNTLLDVIALIVVGLPSIIAAVSSLMNGHRSKIERAAHAEALEENTQLTKKIEKKVNGRNSAR